MLGVPVTQESSKIETILGMSELEANMSHFFQKLSLRKEGKVRDNY